MSDNEDLLGDDVGDQSLADYNLGNEEEEQLLADDYESGPQNVPVSLREDYSQAGDMVPMDYGHHGIEYAPQPLSYQAMPDTESVVPNITVQVPNVPLSYTVDRHYEAEHAVPPAIPAMPVESPQIVPSDISGTIENGEGRERFISERPVGAQRMPQVRDIPDTLDKVVIPRGGYPQRGRTSWRNPHYNPRHSHPYRRNNAPRGNFPQRSSFPPPQLIRPNLPPQIRPEIMRPDMRHDQMRMEIRHDQIRPEIRHEQIRPEIRHDQIRPEIRHDQIRPEIRHDQIRPEIRHDQIRPEIRHDQIRPEIRQPMIRQDMHQGMIRPEIRQQMIRPEIHQQMIRPEIPQQMIRPDMMHPGIRQDMIRPEIREMRPDMDRPFQDMFRPRFPPFERFERPAFGQIRGQFERPMFPFPRQFGPRFPREIAPNSVNVPQVTIRQEPEVRMLPVLPPNLPPAGLAGKKVLINPHFKGNFQPVEGLPVYIPTRIQKSPPHSPPLEKKFGAIKDIDDAAERFIAEQRNALARAASRRTRRSPQRYIENTTIEIANDLAPRPTSSEDDLLRRQEQFINDNRAGLRRRMRSPSPPPRRSPSPRRRDDTNRPTHNDEESDYKRRVREQESLRERVLRAKEVRRRKNAVAYKQMQEREREEKEKTQPQKEPEEKPAEQIKPEPIKPKPTENLEDKPVEKMKPVEKFKPVEKLKPIEKSTMTEVTKADTTRNTPEKSPEQIKEKKSSEKEKIRERSPVKKDDEVNSTCEGLTPPWKSQSDDELDLILGDIDGFLSDDDDTGRFKDKPAPRSPPKSSSTDLRSKIAPKDVKKPAQRQKIVFAHDDDKKRDKTPPRRAVVSSTKTDDDTENKASKIKPKLELSTNRSRQRITFGQKDNKQEKEKEKEKTPPFSNRRVILQRKTKDSEPNAGIFSRAVRTVFAEKGRKAEKDDPKIEFESDSDVDEDKLLNEDTMMAIVSNLPHGMTDTRIRTLAGNDVQNLILDKEDRSAKITFKTTNAAESFRKKFNNKMVAASRLTVTLR